MRKTRKLLAILLCLAMCFSLLPTWAFAEEAEEPEETATETAVTEAEEAEDEETVPGGADGEDAEDPEISPDSGEDLSAGVPEGEETVPVEEEPEEELEVASLEEKEEDELVVQDGNSNEELEALRAAAAALTDYTVTTNLTIPGNDTIDAREIKVTVAGNVTLTVQGEFICRDLDIQGSVVTENGNSTELTVTDTIVFGTNGGLVIGGGHVSLPGEDYNLWSGKLAFTGDPIQQGLNVNLNYALTEDNFMTVMDNLPGYRAGIQHFLDIRFDYTLEDSISFDANVNPQIGPYTFTIADGGSLTVNYHLDLLGTELIVEAGGALYGSDNISLQLYEGHEASIAVMDGASSDYVLLPAEAPPTNLTWSEEEPGMFSFNAPVDTLVDGGYSFYLWKKGAAGEEDDIIASGIWHCAAGTTEMKIFLDYADEKGSGTYYYTLQTLGDYETTGDSEEVTSPEWSYTRPNAKFRVRNLHWEGKKLVWVLDQNGADETELKCYSLILYLGVPSDETKTIFNIEPGKSSVDLTAHIKQKGNGIYSGFFRAESRDITAVLYSDSLEVPKLTVTKGNATPSQPSPTELYWGERNGMFSFRANAAAEYEIKLYHLVNLGDDMLVKTGSVHASMDEVVVIDWLPSNAETYESAVYYYTVQVLGDGSTNDSELERSDQWTYTRPDTRIAAPTGLTVDGPSVTWTEPEDIGNVLLYQVELFYSGDSSDLDGAEALDVLLTEPGQTSVDIGRYVLQKGTGWYGAAITALTNDINAALNSERVMMDSGVQLDEDDIEAVQIADFEEFRTACTNGAEYFNLNNRSSFTIRENLTVPEDMYLEAWGTTVVVPENVLLTVEGEVTADGLVLNGGVLVHDSGRLGVDKNFTGSGSLTIDGEDTYTTVPYTTDFNQLDLFVSNGGKVTLDADVTDAAGLQAFLAAAESGVNDERFLFRVEVLGPVMLNGDLSVPEKTSVEILAGTYDWGSFTGAITVPIGTKLINNWHIGVMNEGSISVKGQFINNGRIDLDYAYGGTQGGTVGSLALNGGSYRGNGEIGIRTGGSAATALPGMDPAFLSIVREDAGGITYVYTGGLFDELKAVIAEGPGEDGWRFQIREGATLTVYENLTIPAGISLEGWNAKIAIPKGVTLTLEGSAKIGAMEIAGTVRVVDRGSLSVEGLRDDNGPAEVISTAGTGVLKIEGTECDAMVPMGTNLNAARVQLLYGAKLKLHAKAYTGSELAGAINAFAPVNNGNYRAFIEVLGDCELVADLEIPANAEVIVINATDAGVPWDEPPGSIAGGLLVPDGATLIVNGFLAAQNAVVTVEGTLFNNAQINLENAYGEFGDCGRLILDEGNYAGTGNIWVNTVENPDSHVVVPDPGIFAIDRSGDGTNYRLGQYLITYDPGGASGTVPEAETYNYGESVWLDAPANLNREGYEFTGWYNFKTGRFYAAEDLPDDFDDLHDGTNDDVIVLIAAWARSGDGYKVVFDANEGELLGGLSEQVPDTEIAYQDGYRVFLYGLYRNGEEYWNDDADGGLKRDGYAFAGWNTKPDGSGKTYANGSVVNLSPENSVVTLYAQWEPDMVSGDLNVESGKKLDVANASGISGTWSIVSGGEYAAITAKGILTAKTVTEMQTVQVRVTGARSGVVNVVVHPQAISLQIGHYPEAIGDQQEAEDAAFNDWENWVPVTGQTVYVPYSGTNVRLAFQANPTPDDSDRSMIVWTSSDKKGSIVGLDTERGHGQLIVTAKAAGTVTLTATCGKVKATVKLVIGDFITEIAIKTTDAKGNPIFANWTDVETGNVSSAIRGGSTVTLQADYDKSAKYTNTELIWELVEYDEWNDEWFPAQNIPYADMTAGGKLTTTVVGEPLPLSVRVSVKANPEVFYIIPLLVTPSVQSISIAPPEVSGMRVGDEPIQLLAEVVPSCAAGEIIWKSSNTAIATVDEEGIVTAVGAKLGAVTITATAADGSKKSASVKLTVANPTSVNINNKPEEPEKIELAGGEKITLSVAGNPKVTWSSADPSVATVTAKGVVTAMKIARDTDVDIIATADDGSTDSITLTVLASSIAAPVTAISLTGGGSLVGGNSLTLKAAITDPKKPTNKTLIWSSSDESVATVSAKGVVTTKPVDERKDVVITVRAADGAGAQEQVRLSVCPKVRSVTISLYWPGNIVNGMTQLVSRDEDIWIRADVYPEDSLSGAIEWKSSNAKIAQVKGEKIDFSGGKTGTVTLTATATDGSKASATVKLNVVNRVYGVRITNGDANLQAGKKMTMKAEINPLDATNTKLVWSIRPEDAPYATIDQKGVLTAKKVTDVHTIRVTVTSLENESASAWTNVYLYPAS